MNKRQAGILMPITALPSRYGVGTLGEEAERFVDFLAASGQGIWQVLPLVPTGFGDSPYQSCCASAGNPYMIAPERLVARGLLTEAECEEYSCESGTCVDYGLLFQRRLALLRLAFSRFDCSSDAFCDFVNKGDFCDYAEFMALKEQHGWRSFRDWEPQYKSREPSAMKAFREQKKEEISFWQFTQYIFFEDWFAIKGYANKKGISIMGDMPLYVAEDSAEVWAHPELFLLNEYGDPIDVAGVPPDYFSATGQLWGNPLYRWDEMKKDGYQWWTSRLKRALVLYDVVRIDHFRGFDRYYAVPGGSADARYGEWRHGPKAELFADKKDWSIVAEDLGTLDEGVYALMREVGYPGMKVMEFGLDGSPQNEHKPSQYSENTVAYTGTHDNAPMRLFIESLSAEGRKVLYDDLKSECKRAGVSFRYRGVMRAVAAANELLYASAAKTAILPMQDILGLGEGYRTNLPGTCSTDNWSWRLPSGLLTEELARSLKALAEKHGRA